jgi:hypothetical protein
MISTLPSRGNCKRGSRADGVDDLTEACREWIDPKTSRPKNRCTWHGLRNFRDVAVAIGQGETYDVYYSAASSFTHTASAIHRLYVRGGTLQPVAESRFVSQQSVLAIGFLLKFIAGYVDRFGVDVPMTEFQLIADAMARFSPV